MFLWLHLFISLQHLRIRRIMIVSHKYLTRRAELQVMTFIYLTTKFHPHSSLSPKGQTSAAKGVKLQLGRVTPTLLVDLYLKGSLSLGVDLQFLELIS